MKPSLLASCLAACALAAATSAQATEQAAITNAHPASATSAPTAVRTLKFTTHHAVPVSLTVRKSAPVSDGWSPQFRFAGQTDLHTCAFHLPKAGEVVKPGETAVGTLLCSTPWQLYDNGLSFEAFEEGRKVAEGTLRP